MQGVPSDSNQNRHGVSSLCNMSIRSCEIQGCGPGSCQEISHRNALQINSQLTTRVVTENFGIENC
jgi:hypothetical protein